MNKKQAANAAQAVLDANREAIVFDSAKVHACFTAMGQSDAEAKASGESKAASALELCKLAEIAGTESRSTGATEIDKGWSAEIRAMLPSLATEGSPFVKVKTEDGKDTRYTLTGYGRNVNSIARGFCQYAELEASKAETYVECRELVEARRAEDRTDKEKALSEAKDALDEVLKAIRANAVKGGDVDLIAFTTEGLQPVLDELEAMHADPDEESATEETEPEAKQASAE